MESETSEQMKPNRKLDSAYSFSFAIGIGLILFIGGLVISLTLGQGTSIGLVFGIPLLIAGLLLPVVMMRDMFTRNEVKGACPYCSAQIKTSDATIRLRCNTCGKEVVVRDMKLLPGEDAVST
jgi:hypothetical protein